MQPVFYPRKRKSMLGPENPVKIAKRISNYQAMYAYKHTYLKKRIYVYMRMLH